MIFLSFVFFSIAANAKKKKQRYIFKIYLYFVVDVECVICGAGHVQTLSL